MYVNDYYLLLEWDRQNAASILRLYFLPFIFFSYVLRNYIKVSQLYELLNSYMPKITKLFIFKIIFNNLSSDNSIRFSFHYVESK